MRFGMNMPNNMEPMLRKLGLPTELNQGILVCRQDYKICSPGQVLSAEQAHLLKQFGIQMADFRIELICGLEKQGGFEQY